MPSSYTTSLRLTLPATGENSGTWGTLVNTGITELTDAAIAGYVSIAMTDADYTLTVANGLTDQARRMMLNMTGTLTAARNVICPTASKLYIIKNATTGGFAITLKTSAGTGISIPNGSSMLLMCNGTDVVDAITQFSNGAFTNLSYTGTLTGGTGVVNLGSGQFYKDASGNVGIGTVSPTAVLDVRGSAYVIGAGGTRTTDTVSGNGFEVVPSTTNNVLSYNRTTAAYLPIRWRAGVQSWEIDNAEQMRLTSTGLGIGTSSPSFKLDVSVGTNTIAQQWQGAGTNFTLRLKSGTGSTQYSSVYRLYMDYLSGTNTNGYIDFYRGTGGDDGYLVFGTNGSDRMTLNAAGNLGLGVTPSAWSASGTALKGLEVGRIGSGIGVNIANGNTNLTTNAYYGSGGWTYANTGSYAGYYNISSSAGTHAWYNAPSGTAGNAITFTQAMTLDASGNLGIGTATPVAKLDVVGQIRSSSVLTAGYVTGADNTYIASNGATGGGCVMATLNFAQNAYQPITYDASYYAWRPSGTELMRLNSTGLGIGTNAPKAAFETSATSNAPSLTAASGVAALTTDSSVRLIFGGYTTAPYGFWLQTKDNQTVGGNGSGTSYPLLLNPIGGNVGIGLTTPSTVLEVRPAAETALAAENAGILIRAISGSVNRYSFLNFGGSGFAGSVSQVASQTTTIGTDYLSSAGALVLTTKAAANATPTERMRIDSAGNLGLGVTPSAWNISVKAFDVGAIQSVFSNGIYAIVGANLFTNAAGATVYKTTTAASYYQQQLGAHSWYTAPSGTAGNAITFTQAMTLDASGNLLVGTTANGGNFKFLVQTATSLTGAFVSTGTNAFVNFSDSTSTNSPQVGSAGDNLLFRTQATERARITSGGNLLVGTTTALSTVRITAEGNSQTTAVPFQSNDTRSDGAASASFIFSRLGATVGQINTTNSTTAYATSSDYRLKNNPQSLTGSGAFIDALQPKTWEWTADGSKGVGFIAHEVQAVSPGSVVGEKDAVDADGKPVMQAMEYGSAEFIANIIAELQSLRARVASLETQP